MLRTLKHFIHFPLFEISTITNGNSWTQLNEMGITCKNIQIWIPSLKLRSNSNYQDVPTTIQSKPF